MNDLAGQDDGTELLARGPERLHEEADRRLYRDDLCGHVQGDIEDPPQSLRPQMAATPHRAVADCLEEAGDALFTFTRLPPSNGEAREQRMHRTSARGVQAADQDADRAAVGRYRGDVVLALLASGQITMRKVDGWHTLASRSRSSQLTSPPDPLPLNAAGAASPNSNTTGDGTRVSALTLIAFSCPLSMFDVFEQVCVDLILERRAHSVRRALIDLQRGILGRFCSKVSPRRLSARSGRHLRSTLSPRIAPRH